MGLGGLARDSILDLTKLAQQHEEQEDAVAAGGGGGGGRLHRRRATGDGSALGGSWNKGSAGGEEFLFLDHDDDAGPASEASSLASPSPFETSLNDSLSGSGPAPATAAAAASSPTSLPPTSAASAAATSYSNVSATNSRSLDSYNNKKYSWEEFSYEGYADYYSDAYNYDDDGYVDKDDGKEEAGGLFCCLFAPWARSKKAEKKSGAEREQGKAEAAPSAEGEATPGSSAAPEGAAEAPTSTPTPAANNKTKGSPGCLVPTPVPALEEDEETFHTSREFETDNFVDSLPLPPSTPHMLSGGAEESASSPRSVSPGAFDFDEKKEDHSPVRKAPEPKEETKEVPPLVKGILKIRRCSASIMNIAPCPKIGKKGANEKAKGGANDSPTKRHLFPAYEPKKPAAPPVSSSVDGASSASSSIIKKIEFNPMARVLTIPSRRDIPMHHKCQVWWQRRDYDEFKKTGRIISKVMECGGSEVWLGTATPTSVPRRSSSESSDGSSDEEYHRALSKYVDEENVHVEKDRESASSKTGNKWWCKFGHSRRGLEHIASSVEGKARQQSVLLAAQMVLNEQRRQRVSRTKDPNKLRNVSARYTSWARDLALAAGSADAETVASGFDPGAACRARHFARRVEVAGTGAAGGGVAMAVTSQLLDANTHAGSPGKGAGAGGGRGHQRFQSADDGLSHRAQGFIPGGDATAVSVRS